MDRLSNAKLQYLRSLHLKKNQQLEKKFLVEGEHLIEEAEKRGILEYVISCEKEFKNIKTYFADGEVLKKLSQTITLSKYIGLCKYFENENNQVAKRILALDNLQDPGNVGTLIRSAQAFNFDAVILLNGSADKYNYKLIRASQGAIFHVAILEGDITLLKEYQTNGYQLIVTSLDKDSREVQKDPNGKFVLIIGNEGHGVANEIKDMADLKIKIRMSESIDSLNAAIAGSIIMHQLSGEGK